ncbi:hypothetical protein D3C72_2103430 [compost metagenome]
MSATEGCAAMASSLDAMPDHLSEKSVAAPRNPPRIFPPKVVGVSTAVNDAFKNVFVASAATPAWPAVAGAAVALIKAANCCVASE